MTTSQACGQPTYTASASPSLSTSQAISAKPSHSRIKSSSSSSTPSTSESPSPNPSVWYYTNTPSRSAIAVPTRTAYPSPGTGFPPCYGFPIKGLRPGSPLTLFGSTAQAPRYADACQDNSPTVWYTLQPDPYANITFTTCNSYTNFDTVLNLRTGVCTNLQCLMSNDNVCSSYGSTITFSSAPDMMYFLSVSGVNGATGNYELIVSTTGSADPTCAEAVFLPGPYLEPMRIVGSNQNSVVSVLNSCGLQSNDRSVWYHLSPLPGSPMVVSTCSDSTDFDTVLSIFQGTCGSLQCVMSNDNNCTTSYGNMLASTIHFTPTSNSYYAVVSGKGGSEGYYQLYLRQEQSPGYSCESPRTFVAGTSGSRMFTGSNRAAGNLTSSICSTETGRAYWFYITVT